MTPLPLITAQDALLDPALVKRLATLTGQAEAQIQADIRHGSHDAAGDFRARLTKPALPANLGDVAFHPVTVRAEPQDDGTWSIFVDAEAIVGKAADPIACSAPWTPLHPELLVFAAEAEGGAPLAELDKLGEIGARAEVDGVLALVTAIPGAPRLSASPPVRGLRLVIGADGMAGSRAYFALAEGWAIAGDFQLAELLVAAGRVWRDGQPVSLAVGLAATVAYHRTRLIASIDVPDVAISARLDTEQAAPRLPELLADMGLQEDFWPNLEIAALNLAYEPALGHHKLFHIEVDGEWQILPGLAIEQILLHLETSDQATDLEFQSQLHFLAGRPDAFALRLDARYQPLDSEQTLTYFEATLTPDAPIHFGALIEDLLRRVGLPLDLPGPIHDLAIYDFGLSFEILRQRFPGADAGKRVDRSSRRLSIGFTVGSATGKWEPVPGLLAFEPARIDLRLGEQAVDIRIRETVDVFGAAWLLDVQLPSLVGSVALAGELKIAPALAYFHLPTEGLDEMALRDATMQFDAGARSVAIHLELAGAWEHGHFSLEKVQFALDYAGGQGGGCAASFGAVSRITRGGESGDIELRVAADHAGPGLGWRLEGAVDASGHGITVVDVGTSFGIDKTQLDGLGSLKGMGLTHLGVRYDTHVKEFAADCSIHVSDTATIELAIERRPAVGVSRAAVNGSSGTAGAKTPAVAAALAGAGAGTSPVAGGATSPATVAYEVRFSGVLKADGVEFDLVFLRDGTGDHLIGVYVDRGGGEKVVQSLASALSPGDHKELEHVAFPIKSAIIAWQRPPPAPPGQAVDVHADRKSAILFAADMDVGVDLSGLGHLPLVGSSAPAGQQLALNFSPMYATQALDNNQVNALRAIVPPGSPILPETISVGLTITTSMLIGGRRVTVNLAGMQARKVDPKLGSPRARLSSGGNPAPAAVAPFPAPSKLQWIMIQRSLGRVLNLRRIGIGMDGAEVTILLDGSITVGPLTLDLMGLGARYNLDSHDLAFALQGIGLDLRAEVVAIGASFANMGGDFVGRASLQMETFGLTALGAFSESDGHPSMFIYGVLNYPLGGPVFFFVEGLAAGFGFNRHLRLPPVSEVDRFPFVAEAMGMVGTPPAVPGSLDTSGALSLGEELQKLHEYVHPAVGEYFLAAGIKFNSFHIVDAFALVTVAIDLTHMRTEIALLGVAMLQVPSESPQVLAFVQLDVLATVDPQEGTVLFQAQLTSRSWVLSADCHLQGGFAAGLWFLGEHAGDFVYTLGGYHPHFPVPAHYPRVPRLGFHWNLSSEVTVRGELYYALTPVAAMAGGRFSATWNAGGLKAWFDFQADFLIQWKPLHFEADLSIEIGASYDTPFGTISGSLGAGVSVWGPDSSNSLSGRAHFTFGPISFAIDFGSGAVAHDPLDWDGFQKTFLPPAGAPPVGKPLVTANVVAGLVRTLEVGEGKSAESWAVVDPRHFVLDVSTVVPVTEWRIDDPEAVARPIDADLKTRLGVAPMNRSEPLPNAWTVSIRHDGDSAAEDFEIMLADKAFPGALWGRGFQQPDSPIHIHAPGALRVRPAKLPAAGTTAAIRRANLSFEPHGVEILPRQPVPAAPVEAAGDPAAILRAVRDGLATPPPERAAALERLGLDAARLCSVGAGYADALRAVPRVGRV